jgi:nascent polypeptide-associated complex subunit alpha
MIPGGARSNPRQVEMMMRRLGMTSEPVPGVEEVVLRTKTQEHVFRAPEVTVLTVQGVRTYQVVGTPEIRPRGAGSARTGSGAPSSPEAPSGPPEEDIRLVMEQANVSHEEAVEALLAAHGAPAEAILAIMTREPR